jgi:hypothetical protein
MPAGRIYISATYSIPPLVLAGRGAARVLTVAPMAIRV